MNQFLTVFLISAVALPLTAARADDSPKKIPAEPAGMKSIFNGKDLEGWDGDSRLWSVVDGAIRGETVRFQRRRKRRNYDEADLLESC